MNITPAQHRIQEAKLKHQQLTDALMGAQFEATNRAWLYASYALQYIGQASETDDELRQFRLAELALAWAHAGTGERLAQEAASVARALEAGLVA